MPDAAAWHADVDDVRRACAAASGSAGSTSTCTRATGKYGHAAQFDLAPGIAGRQLAEGVLVCNFSRDADGARPRGDAVPRVRPPDAPRARRRPGVGAVLRRRHRVGLRRGALADARGVGLGRRRAASPSPPTPTASRSRAELVERMRAANEFGKGLHARTQMFYAALSYRLHQDVPDDITATMRELQATLRPVRLRARTPTSSRRSGTCRATARATTRTCGAWSSPRTCSRPSTADDLFDTEVAHRYRDRVLAPGGSRDAADLVADFLGRPYGFDAFERWLERPTAGDATCPAGDQFQSGLVRSAPFSTCGRPQPFADSLRARGPGGGSLWCDEWSTMLVRGRLRSSAALAGALLLVAAPVARLRRRAGRPPPRPPPGRVDLGLERLRPARQRRRPRRLRSAPAAVAGLADVVDVHGGREHVVALTVGRPGLHVGQQPGGPARPRRHDATGRGRPRCRAVQRASTAVETGHNHTPGAARQRDGVGLRAQRRPASSATAPRRCAVRPVQVQGAHRCRRRSPPAAT